ncbi:MAG: DUF4411 family protein [Cytophagales bacterium]|nr:DUF4411 family protein [Cytophagales bacterium]
MIIIQQYYPEKLFKGLWKIIREFLSDGRIQIHQMVYDELIPSSNKPRDEIGQLIKEYKENIEDITEFEISFVQKIIEEYPKLIDTGKEKDEADPWLISAVRDKMEDTQIFGDDSPYALVTQENQRKSNKIPAVCRAYEIRNMNLHQFFERVGIKFTTRID